MENVCHTTKSRGRIHINAHILIEGFFGRVSNYYIISKYYLRPINMHVCLTLSGLFDWLRALIHRVFTRRYLRSIPSGLGTKMRFLRIKIYYGKTPNRGLIKIAAGETRGKRLPHQQIPRQGSYQRPHLYRGILWKG